MFYPFPVLTSCLAEMFYPHQLLPPDQFAEPRVYLFSQVKWYHWIILSMKDEQGAGNVFHTVKQKTMSQRLRAIPSFPTPTHVHFKENCNDKHVLWVINYNLKPYLGTIHLVCRKFASDRHAYKIFLLLRPEKSGSLHCKSSPPLPPSLVWFQYWKLTNALAV